MRYPESLELHATPQYNYLETFPTRKEKNEDAYYTYAYYHDKTQYPLLMHRHDYYEINIITNGFGRHYIENNSAKAHTGSVFVIPPNIMHGYYEGSNLEIFHLALSKRFMSTFSQNLHSLENFSMLFEIEPMLRKALNEEFFLRLTESELNRLLPELNNLIFCEETDYAGMTTLKNAKALSVIGLITCLYTQKKSSVEKNDQPITKNLLDCVNYIHENYMEKIHTPDLAALCFMSYSTFSRNFKKIFNLSPANYIMKLRIEKAKTLLKTTDKSISNIAQDCGFFDLSHFSHYFYKFEKCTPLNYRKKLADTNP
ncbi:MAG: helix-turn-helix transcriptional regulator [Clostridia bacterium]|nr:helix-turn-helix transcriptional regulator [Clostridia bacterium]